MSQKYDPKLFKKRLAEKINPSFPPCPFCGNTERSISAEYVSLFTQTAYNNLQLGRNIPCGVLFCEHCGHVDLFALGTLDMLLGDNAEG